MAPFTSNRQTPHHMSHAEKHIAQSSNKEKMTMMLRDLPFPDDILIEILSRLPVKSLLQFRSVSKRWLNLITAPDFIKLHLTHSVQNNPKIIYPTYDDTYSIDYESCYDPKEHDFPLNDQSLIGSCNGVLCISDRENYMALWNPATKEDIGIPYASVEERLEDNERDVVIGFGYDPVTDKYKVVRSVFFFRDKEHSEYEECEVKIFVLGSKEWRKIDDPPCCLQDQHQHMAPQVNGALHWLLGLPIGSSSLDSKIMSFDVGREEFRTIPWIDTIGNNTEVDATLGVLQGCLSVLLCDSGDTLIDIWSMKDYGVKESWAKLFSIRLSVYGMEFSSIEPLVLRSNGELLLKSSGELYSYNTTNDRVTMHRLCDIPHCCYPAHTYAESLVSIVWLVCSMRRDEDAP